MVDLQSSKKTQSFTKTLELNSRFYKFKVIFEPKNAILRFKVTDQSNPKNLKHFFNNFSLNQSSENISEQEVKQQGIVKMKYQNLKFKNSSIEERFETLIQMIDKKLFQISEVFE